MLAQTKESGVGFHHEALFYDSDDCYLAATVPFVQEALSSSGAALVAVTRPRTELLRRGLGADAQRVEFLEMEDVGRNPARIIPLWRDFLETNAGTPGGLRGIGEPIWAERSEAELDECRRHEHLLNFAFGEGRPWSLLCPYDKVALGPEVLAGAGANHPFVDDGSASTAWGGEEPWSPFEGELPPPPRSAPSFGFGRDELAGARRLIEREAQEVSLSAYRTTDLVTATSELTANSVLHGGGAGELRTWSEGEELIVEVSDRGRIDEPLVGRVKPPIHQLHGRGLWLANQLCDLVRIRSGSGGTKIRLHVGIG
jgi:anti-sigma regulatory factor (Ser/Thr protein kinase)